MALAVLSRLGALSRVVAGRDRPVDAPVSRETTDVKPASVASDPDQATVDAYWRKPFAERLDTHLDIALARFMPLLPGTNPAREARIAEAQLAYAALNRLNAKCARPSDKDILAATVAARIGSPAGTIHP